MAAVPPSTANRSHLPGGDCPAHISCTRYSWTIFSVHRRKRPGTGYMSPMIPSVNSCANTSGSKPSFLTPHSNESRRSAEPGRFLLASRNARKRAPLPFFSGILPRSGMLTPRRVSSIAKRSSVPYASRGVVHSQFGLPRPALSIGNWPSCSVSTASAMSLSFNSKGLRRRRAFCSARDVGLRAAGGLRVLVVIEAFSLDRRRARSGHEDDEDHAPDGQERVPHRVRDGVAERGDLALRAVADEAERRCGRAAARGGAEEDGVVAPAGELADEQA